MRLKKRIVSLALAAMLLVTAPVSAFATTKFNQSVFDGRDDLRISTDIMAGETSVVPTALDDGQMIIPVLDAGAVITVQPGIFLDDSKDTFILMFKYLGVDWAKLNGIIIKIGDNRYSFSNCYSSHSIDDGYASEYVAFCMKDQTTDMMKDFADHRDEEINVRLVGSAKSIDFVLTDTVKNTLLDMYDLYVAGGGMRSGNMYQISEFDQVYVEKNGKRVIGNVVTTVLDLATGHIPANF